MGKRVTIQRDPSILDNFTAELDPTLELEVARGGRLRAVNMRLPSRLLNADKHILHQVIEALVDENKRLRKAG